MTGDPWATAPAATEWPALQWTVDSPAVQSTATSTSVPVGTRAPTWQIRALGGAVGAVASCACAFVSLAVIPVLGALLALAGFVGVPIATVLGVLLAPGLVARTDPKATVLTVSAAATVLGTAGFGLVLYALAYEWVEYPWSLPSLIFGYLILGTLFDLLFGWPFTLAVVAVWSWALRRLVRYVRRLWIPSIVVVGLVALQIGGCVAGVGLTVGEQAAMRSDRRALEYRVDNQSAREYLLDVRSLWKGQPTNGSFPAVLFAGSCVGRDWLQSSWSIWLIDPEQTNADPSATPLGSRLASSDAYPFAGPVRVALTIRPDGTTSLLLVPAVEPIAASSFAVRGVCE
jgi:hypothetical protein